VKIVDVILISVLSLYESLKQAITILLTLQLHLRIDRDILRFTYKS